MGALRYKPNDVRGFVHRRIIEAVGGFISGGPLGAVGGFVFGGGGGGGHLASAEHRADIIAGAPGHHTPEGQSIATALNLLPGAPSVIPQGPCPRPLVKNQVGQCVAKVEGFLGQAQRSLPGGATGLMGVGEPGIRDIQRRVCPRKHVLGADGLCYPKGAITNAQRWWPAARKPLLTGGDLGAIAKAARAATRLKTATKRLQKLGMMPKPKKAMTITQAKKLLHHAS